jgi:hypothetical protein
MGDANQLAFLKRFVPVCRANIVEVGSKEYGSTSSFRDFYKDAHIYLGVDAEAGEGVDFVWDYAEPFTQGEFASPSQKHGTFDLAICCSVLEHVRRPWWFAENLTREIRQCGLLYISAPWVWRYHAYPDDYWRFSWRGIEVLFPDFAWDPPIFSTNVPGEFFEARPGVDDALALYAGKRKHLPYLMVNMIGRKK